MLETDPGVRLLVWLPGFLQIVDVQVDERVECLVLVVGSRMTFTRQDVVDHRRPLYYHLRYILYRDNM